MGIHPVCMAELECSNPLDMTLECSNLGCISY